MLVGLWLAVSAGCASGPYRGLERGSDRDGPEARPPLGLLDVPDAVPQLEPVRSGGPNKPYDIAGRTYVPMTGDAPFSERGLASWYGRKFNGTSTSSGERYDMYAMTAAHPTLPIPSYARVRNPANGREVVVRINDRGPFHPGRIVDLSYTAALKLDVLRGVTPVELSRITFDDIRTGAWRRPEATSVAAVEPSLSSLPPTAEPAAVESGLANAEVPLAAVPTLDAPALGQPARGFWVQLGAFRQRAGAEGFQQRVAETLAWLSPLLAVFDDAALFRLQAGPYPSRDDAKLAAERIREGLQLTPVIVERR